MRDYERVSGTTGTAEIRAWAMALPGVTEKAHFRFKVPLWQVQGKTFLGMGPDETTAVFCIVEPAADTAAAATPYATVVRRMDARRSYLGLEVRLGGAPAARVEELVRAAWAAQAPAAVVRKHFGAPS